MNGEVGKHLQSYLSIALVASWLYVGQEKEGEFRARGLGIGLGSQEIFRIFVIYPSIFFGFITILPPDFSVQCTQPILILRA